MRANRIIPAALLAAVATPALAGLWCPEKLTGHRLTIRHDRVGHSIQAVVDYDMSCPQFDPSVADGCTFYKTLSVLVQDSINPHIEWYSEWMAGRFAVGCQDGKPGQPPDRVGPDKKTDPTPGTLCNDPHYGVGYVIVQSCIHLGPMRPDGTQRTSVKSRKILNLCAL